MALADVPNLSLKGHSWNRTAPTPLRCRRYYGIATRGVVLSDQRARMMAGLTEDVSDFGYAEVSLVTPALGCKAASMSAQCMVVEFRCTGHSNMSSALGERVERMA